MTKFSEIEEFQRVYSWGRPQLSHETIEELPTYVDEQGRTIKVCPPRWAGGVSPQGPMVKSSSGVRRQPL